MAPKRSLKRPPPPPTPNHPYSTYTVANKIYSTRTRELVASYKDVVHHFNEEGRRLFRGRTVFVLQVPSLQVSTSRNWTSTQEMYFPISGETMPGLEERWNELEPEKVYTYPEKYSQHQCLAKLGCRVFRCP